MQAAGIAYRVLFSIAPLAIVLVSIFGLVLQDDGIRHDVVNADRRCAAGVCGGQEGRRECDYWRSPRRRAPPGSSACSCFAWAATGMMTAIRRGLESAMGVAESRPLARAKLVDLGLIVGAAVLVLVYGGTHPARRSRAEGLREPGRGRRPRGRHVGRRASCTGPGSSSRSWSCCCSTGSSRPAAYAIRDGLAGAIVTAILFLLISLASAGSARGRRGSAWSTARSRRRSSFSTPCISTPLRCCSVPR